MLEGVHVVIEERHLARLDRVHAAGDADLAFGVEVLQDGAPLDPPLTLTPLVDAGTAEWFGVYSVESIDL